MQTCALNISLALAAYGDSSGSGVSETDSKNVEATSARNIKRERDKPRLALNNITAGVREREGANRTREAGHLDEIQGAVANPLELFRNGAVGFIDWLGLW